MMLARLSAQDLVDRVDFLRLDATRKLAGEHRSAMGQFLTPAPVARLMASMLVCNNACVHILDAGAGVGSLFAACVAELCSREQRPEQIRITAYELDDALIPYLGDTIQLCQAACKDVGIVFDGRIEHADFISSASDQLAGPLLASEILPYTCAIINPPYRKINTNSEARRLLRRAGIETSNLYTGFLALAVQLLQIEGELITITPRSFCNGSYFRSFRRFFLDAVALRRLHIFESRQQAFRDDAVLQETIIMRAVKGATDRETVTITSTIGPDDEFLTGREIDYTQVVHPADPQSFIHIVPDELGQQIAERMRHFRASLDDLGLKVSTGRVVDFRARKFLRTTPDESTVPLIWPTHFDSGYISWPKPVSRKPEAIAADPSIQNQLVPNATYVLVKRFSTKEEKRRIMAAVYDPDRIAAPVIGFENHLNYFHQNGAGLDQSLAKGIAAYLNSTLVDEFFRQFNGHTQVNATDLRTMRYPDRAQLVALGEQIVGPFPPQHELDLLIERELLRMTETPAGDPVQAKRRIEEAQRILRDLGLPHAQQNERSALILLALLDIKPATSWADAHDPMLGIRPILDFVWQHYGRPYAENTRETFRRQTIHQFLEAALIIQNPDNPSRATNSALNVYQIERSALELLRTFGTTEWDHNLRAYLASVETLQRRYAQEREMQLIPVTVAPGTTIRLSPGGQNVLVEKIIHEFAPRFTPGGRVLYVGDTAEKWAYFDREGLTALGVAIASHGKMPDVIIHYIAKNWLLLIEAVTSHGPIDAKRRAELQRLFQGTTAPLVYVTAFLTRRAMVEYLDAISWETEVWVADQPTHMIHFNGERFLGPYSNGFK